jgi:hypothetical protein
MLKKLLKFKNCFSQLDLKFWKENNGKNLQMLKTFLEVNIKKENYLSN